MHHWHSAHEGHAEHCCLCIPNNVGTHIIGSLMVLGLIGQIANLTSGYGLAQTIVGILVLGYPSIFFIKMCHHNDEHSRKSFAGAFKIFSQIANVIYIIAAVLVLVLGIWGFIQTGSVAVLGGSVVAVLALLLGVFLVVHYNRVVQTYAEHAHHEEYEKQ